MNSLSDINNLVSREEVLRANRELNGDGFSIRRTMTDPLFEQPLLTTDQRDLLLGFSPDSVTMSGGADLIQDRIYRLFDDKPIATDSTDIRAIFFTGPSSGGKTSGAVRTATHRGLPILDGDVLHSEEAVTKMSNDRPLTAEDRDPWIEKIKIITKKLRQMNIPPVVVCSALTSRIRNRLRQIGPVLFIDLHAPLATLQERARSREHPYIRRENSERFIANQFELHQSDPELNNASDTLSLDTRPDPEEVSRQINRWIDEQSAV